jgi:uncharacterized protein (DUF58 family)
VTLQQEGTVQRPQSSQSADFEGVRPYRAGDPLKWVVWKKAAKALALPEQASDSQFDVLLTSRDRPGTPLGVQWLTLESTGCADPERALSRLAAWVIQADQKGVAVGLELPNLRLDPDTGAAHVQQCMRALAEC